jgi:LAO/AO transport system kinase
MEKDKIYKSALSVSEGVHQPPSVNPNPRKVKRTKISTKDFVAGILDGDRVILSRAITLVESNLPEHTLQAQQIVEKCLPFTGKSIRVGITGVPGVGKSSFIESLGSFLTTSGHNLSVLAIDPSSKKSKGSILGDKTRMETLAVSPAAFIRPSPSAGSLGGVARKTRESILLCEAAGFDVIFVETVGVGQSELAVHSMVDFFLLLMLAGAGDELQGIKRGIMEMADLIAITKADGENIAKTNQACSDYRSALHLFPLNDSNWVPQVLSCSARNKTGINEIWDKIIEFRNHTVSNGYFYQNRKEQARYWMLETINEQLKANFYNNELIREKIKELERKVLNDKINPFIAAQKIIEFYYKPGKQ